MTPFGVGSLQALWTQVFGCLPFYWRGGQSYECHHCQPAQNAHTSRMVFTPRLFSLLRKTVCDDKLFPVRTA